MVERAEIKSINQIELGEFIRFEGIDNQGKWHHNGKVVKIDIGLKFFEMQAIEGLFGFYHPEKHMLFKGEKPTGWDKFEKDSVKFKEDKKEKQLAATPVIKPKKELVFDLVMNNLKLNERKLLKMAITEIGGDENNLKMFIDLAIRQLRNNIS